MRLLQFVTQDRLPMSSSKLLATGSWLVAFKRVVVLSLIAVSFGIAAPASTACGSTLTQDPERTAAEVSANDSSDSATHSNASATPDKPEPVPILPNANEVAMQRELILIILMGIMGLGCTLLAFLAFWMLGKNSNTTDPEKPYHADPPLRK